MLRWFRGEQPRKRRNELVPIKPNDLNYQLLKAEIAKEQAEATRQKNQGKVRTVSGYAENALDQVAKGASELKGVATAENVKKSYRDAADAASNVTDVLEKEEKGRERSE